MQTANWRCDFKLLDFPQQIEFEDKNMKDTKNYSFLLFL